MTTSDNKCYNDWQRVVICAKRCLLRIMRYCNVLNMFRYLKNKDMLLNKHSPLRRNDFIAGFRCLGTCNINQNFNQLSGSKDTEIKELQIDKTHLMYFRPKSSLYTPWKHQKQYLILLFLLKLFPHLHQFQGKNK